MKTTMMIALAASVALGGCASVGRLTSYGAGNADAQIRVQGKGINIWMHPRESFILTGITVGDAAASGALQGLTFGLARGYKPDPREIDAALRSWVAPTGCRVEPVREVGSNDTNYEAPYTCPAGVDLRAIVEGQRDGLMRGEPIRMP